MVTSDLAGLAPFALLHLDSARKVVAANPEAQTILGHSERVMQQRPLSEIIFHDSPFFDLIDRSLDLAGDVTAHAVRLSGPGLNRHIVVDVRLRKTDNGGTVLAFMTSADPDIVDSQSSIAGFGKILGHEIKNPLAGISGAAQLLMRQARDDQTGMLDIIQSETKRIERLISRLSAFELFSSPRLAHFNIHAVLEKVIAAEQAAQGSRINITRAFDPSLPEIVGDQDHLHEALQNITRNASEAAILSGSTPEIRIETAFETSFAIAGVNSSGRPGRAVRISVEDNGPGIPQETRETIFDLFATSKSGGRGLGLTVVSEIINSHNGRIKIDSVPGRTKFSIYLPISRKPDQ